MHTQKWLILVGLFVASSLVLGFAAGPAMAGEVEICTNKIDDDGDKAADCLDPDCAKDPACQKEGTGCSPGFYKNHPEIWVNLCCSGESDPTCGELNTALTCRGSDASCGRSAAAAFLDACTGCSE